MARATGAGLTYYREMRRLIETDDLVIPSMLVCPMNAAIIMTAVRRYFSVTTNVQVGSPQAIQVTSFTSYWMPPAAAHLTSSASNPTSP
jgi:hypothetical protein